MVATPLQDVSLGTDKAHNYVEEKKRKKKRLKKERKEGVLHSWISESVPVVTAN